MPIKKFFFSFLSFAVIAASFSPAFASIRQEYTLEKNENKGNPFVEAVNTIPTTPFTQRGPQPLTYADRMPMNIDLSTALTVIDVEAGVIRKHDYDSTRETIAEGDVIVEGDTVTVPGGSKLYLLLDEGFRNSIAVQGPAEIQVLSTNPYQIHVISGKVFGMLNVFGDSKAVEIFTHNSYARAFGSRFQVSVDALNSKYAAYEGSLWISGRDFKTGRVNYEFGTLDEGRVVNLSVQRNQKETPRPATYVEFAEAQTYIQKIDSLNHRLIPQEERTEWVEESRDRSEKKIQDFDQAIIPENDKSPVEVSIDTTREIDDHSEKYIY